MPQPGDRGGDGRGVVSEVVDDLHAARGAAQFHPALHALKAAQRGAGFVGKHPGVLGRGNGGQGVAAVVRAGLAPAHFAHAFAAQPHLELLLAALRAPAVLIVVEAHHFAPAAAREHALQGVRADVDHELPAARHGAHQIVELGFDGGEIGEDVGVVELQVVEHGGTRAVMHELGAFVEKGGVVFVGFDDKKASPSQPPPRCGGGAFPLPARGRSEIAASLLAGRVGVGSLVAPQTRRGPKVQRHAADEKTGIQPSNVENVRQHRGGGGLAVRARDRQCPAALQHMLGQPLRPADVRLPGIEDRLHQGIAARHHIADDPQIGPERKLVGAVALDQFDAQLLQLPAHGRIDLRVAAGHAVPGLLRQRRQAAHEGTANSKNMNMHGGRF